MTCACHWSLALKLVLGFCWGWEQGLAMGVYLIVVHLDRSGHQEWNLVWVRPKDLAMVSESLL
jgi:hypothetical protein